MWILLAIKLALTVSGVFLLLGFSPSWSLRVKRPRTVEALKEPFNPPRGLKVWMPLADDHRPRPDPDMGATNRMNLGSLLGCDEKERGEKNGRLESPGGEG
ncbi:hypothetical protein EDB82DRAFT_491999 [Fusarium venenatum]|uniref:uncharacterized protein n=1 Tax=Fusarium venenatum TaxID=56646 RepID=UPI001D2E9853|nr:hypothetical protein EDB82DRAFT_491999 [Fusarium venenatum]